MNVDIVLVMLFGLLLLSVGVALLLACLDQRVAPYIDAARAIRNWQAILSQGPSQGPVVEGDLCSYKIQTQHFHGHYFIEGCATIGSAARIHVPPDYLARLSYIDGWSRSRHLDGSAFTLRTDDSGDRVEFLARGRRFCLNFDDDNILAHDGYILNCQVAMHCYVELRMDQHKELDLLFDSLPHIMAMLRDGTAGVLRTELTRRDYRQAMYEIAQVLQSLQVHWQTHSTFESFRRLVRIEFTGLVIRPREEAELKFLDRLERGRSQLDEQISEIEKEINGTRTTLFNEWHAIDTNRRAAVVGLNERVPSAVKSQAESVSDIIVKQQTYEDTVSQSQRLFESAHADLKKYSENLNAAYMELGRFIRTLDAKSKQYLQNPQRTSEPSPQSNSETGVSHD